MPPIVSSADLAAALPVGARGVFIVNLAGKRFYEGKIFEGLPAGDLYFPRPDGAWLESAGKDVLGLREQKESLEILWDRPIADFDTLVGILDEEAAATARNP